MGSDREPKRRKMKRRISSLAASAALALFCCAGVSNAAPKAQWYVVIKAEQSVGLTGRVFCGTKLGAIDGWSASSGDTLQANYDQIAGARITTDVLDNLPDMTASLVASDTRAPIALGETKIWNLRAWLVGNDGVSKTPGNVTLNVWVPSAVYVLDDSVRVSLCEQGKELFVVPPHELGAVAAPLYTWSTYYDGQNDVALQLVATGVPEPSSIFTILSGLVGIGGFNIRKRK